MGVIRNIENEKVGERVIRNREQLLYIVTARGTAK
jgi:hypothetical protein